MLLLLQFARTLVDLNDRFSVTTALLVLNVLIYGFNESRFVDSLSRPLARSVRKFQSYTNVGVACLRPSRISDGKELYRLVSSAFIHLNEVHLLHNMISLLQKGVALEARMGAPAYAFLVLFLATVSHALYVVFAVCMSRAGRSNRWLHSSVAGFSGVLFGMGMVMNCRSRQAANVRWMPLVHAPVKAAAVELVIAQILIPNASFLAHLCGVLAGLIFVVMSIACSSLRRFAYNSFVLLLQRERRRGRRNREYGTGTTGIRLDSR